MASQSNFAHAQAWARSGASRHGEITVNCSENVLKQYPKGFTKDFSHKFKGTFATKIYSLMSFI